MRVIQKVVQLVIVSTKSDAVILCTKSTLGLTIYIGAIASSQQRKPDFKLMPV